MEKAVSVHARKQPGNRIRQGSQAVSLVLYTVAFFLGILTLYPLVFVLSNAISDPVYSAAGKVWLFPIGFSLSAFEFVFEEPLVLRSFINSIVYTTGMVFATVFVSMISGFGLSKKGLVFRKSITLYLLIPMWFSGGLIPSFINMTRLGLYNNLLAVFLPAVFNLYHIILARTFIVRLPSALLEAAALDGATVPGIFFRVVIPLSKPIIAVLALYTALGVWNEWFPYLIYLPSKDDLHPLAFYLVKILQKEAAVLNPGSIPTTIDGVVDQQRLHQIMTQLKYATIVITTLPIMCLYPFAQKHFVQGVMLGSLKE